VVMAIVMNSISIARPKYPATFLKAITLPELNADTPNPASYYDWVNVKVISTVAAVTLQDVIVNLGRRQGCQIYLCASLLDIAAICHSSTYVSVPLASKE